MPRKYKKRVYTTLSDRARYRIKLHCGGWTQSYNPKNPFIYKLSPVPHLIGVYNAKTLDWIANNTLTKKHIQGRALSVAIARKKIINNLLNLVVDG